MVLGLTRGFQNESPSQRTDGNMRKIHILHFHEADVSLEGPSQRTDGITRKIHTLHCYEADVS